MNRVPPLVFWYATEKCDMKCKHCCYPAKDRGDLSTEQAKGIISQAAEMGAKAFAFVGGEPLLRKDIVELCRCCSSEGMIPHVVTKGKSLNEGLAEDLSEAEARVTVGLDTFTHTTADFICNEARMPQVSRQALRTCSRYGILKGSVTAALKPNLDEVPSVLDRMPSEADRLVIFGVRPSGKGKEVYDEFAPAPKRYEDFMKEVAKGTEEDRWEQEVFVYDPLFSRILKEEGRDIESEGGRVCQIGKYLDIDSSGNVMPCLFSKLRFGNALKEPLKKIWSKMKDDEFLNSLRDPGNLRGKCTRCQYNDICGGCRTRSFRLTGDWFASDPLCAYDPSES